MHSARHNSSAVYSTDWATLSGLAAVGADGDHAVVLQQDALRGPRAFTQHSRSSFVPHRWGKGRLRCAARRRQARSGLLRSAGSTRRRSSRIASGCGRHCGRPGTSGTPRGASGARSPSRRLPSRSTMGRWEGSSSELGTPVGVTSAYWRDSSMQLTLPAVPSTSPVNSISWAVSTIALPRSCSARSSLRLNSTPSLVRRPGSSRRLHPPGDGNPSLEIQS